MNMHSHGSISVLKIILAMAAAAGCPEVQIAVDGTTTVKAKRNSYKERLSHNIL